MAPRNAAILDFTREYRASVAATEEDDSVPFDRASDQHGPRRTIAQIQLARIEKFYARLSSMSVIDEEKRSRQAAIRSTIYNQSGVFCI